MRPITPTTPLLLLAPLVLLAAAEVPYGSPDFYPSAERPIGFRGDGNGSFPGATPVTEWWEGTAEQITIAYHDTWGRERTKEVWDIVDDRSKNIVWKTEMPCWANSHPIVVGDRIFTTAEPDLLVCVDAASGAVLWQVRTNAWEAAGCQPAVAERCHRLYEVWQAFLHEPPKNDIVTHGAIATYLEHGHQRLLAAVQEIDPEGGWAEAAAATRAALEHAAQATAGIADHDRQALAKARGGKETKNWDALPKAIEKRISAIAGVDVPIKWPWGNMIGQAMSTPISDGASVYVHFGQGQTACYDLNGERRWLAWFEPEGRMGSLQSMRLAHDVLVDMHGGGKLLRGLDRRTGRTLWEAPTRAADAGGRKGGYFVGSHTVVNLQGADYIVTTLCNIIRASDGRVVGYLPWGDNYGPSGGPTMVRTGPDGDIVLKSANGDGGSSPIVAWRLVVQPDGLVQPVELWRSAEGRACPGYHGFIATPQLAFLPSDMGRVVDTTTGEVLAGAARKPHQRRFSNILAGDLWLWMPDKDLSNQWNLRRPDSKGMIVAGAEDVSDPRAPRPVEGLRLLGGRNWPRMPAHERYVPELYAREDFWGSWQGYGKPAHFLYTDTCWMPAGNRLFVRSMAHLYCIGDPSVPYDWNPDSRPAAISGSLATR